MVLKGHRTASGEKYQPQKFTAAHKTLPFHSFVKVTNIENGKWVIVKINDRGPYSKKYMIDLSFIAAKQLGITNGKGWANVKLETIRAGEGSPAH